MKLLFASALASAFVFLGGAFTPVVAFADESVEGAETSEIVSVEEFVEETESVENTANDEVVEDKEITYDDILAVMGNIAEKEGFKDEWDKTLYHIQTAASEKKVDTMIVLVALVLAFLTVYATVKIVKYKLSNAKIRKIVESLTGVENNGNAQTTAINGLIDEAEKVEGVAADSVRREKALANALEKQNIAIRCLIRGTNIKQDLKDEAFRSLNESDDLCDEAKK
jgi:hypothetical protein